MKQIYTFATVLVFMLATFISGCASTPKQSQENYNEVFYETVEDAHAAAVDALTVLGFEIKKNEDNYVEGYRPRKIGLFVGSGGESVGVWLEPIDEKKVDVKISTAKSFVGIVGQKSWDNEIIAEMKKALL